MTDRKVDVSPATGFCTVKEAIDVIGVGKVQMRAVYAATLCLLYYLLDIFGAGMILPAATCDLQLDTVKKGILTGAPFLGLVISSHIWGFLTDWFGRQKIIVISLWASLVFYMSAALIPHFWVMVVFRFCSGVANAGAQSAIYPYVGEMLPDKQRSKRMVIIGYAAAMSMFMIVGVGWLLERHGVSIHLTESYSVAPWRQQLVLLGLPGLICVAMFSYLPESPKFLVLKGRLTEAFEVLDTIHQKNCNGKRAFPIKSLVNEASHLEMEKNCLSTISSFLGETKLLFRKPYLWPVLGMCFIQCGLYTIGDAYAMWYPELTNRLSIEPSAKVCDVLSSGGAHGPVITDGNWTECYVHVDDKMFIDNTIVGLAYLVSNAIFYFLNSQVDIKYITGFAMAAASICAFALPSLTTEWIIVVSFTVFLMGGGLSIGLTNVLIIEIFPSSVCGMAVGLAQLFGRLATFIGTNAIGILLETQCEATIYGTATLIGGGVLTLLLLPRKVVK